MNFCSNCGHKVAHRVPPGDNLPRYLCDNCGMIHYQNPRIIVGCLCLWDNQIMLCRRDISPQLGYWNVPGGFMENGETAEQGALREAYEEAGVRGEIMGLHSVYSVPRLNQVHLHYLMALESDYFHLTPESSEIRFFSPNELPWSTIAFKSNEFLLKGYLENLAQNAVLLHLGEFEDYTF